MGCYLTFFRFRLIQIRPGFLRANALLLQHSQSISNAATSVSKREILSRVRRESCIVVDPQPRRVKFLVRRRIVQERVLPREAERRGRGVHNAAAERELIVHRQAGVFQGELRALLGLFRDRLEDLVQGEALHAVQIAQQLVIVVVIVGDPASTEFAGVVLRIWSHGSGVVARKNPP